jgi:PIN domain nuclease of toxin-antitoxin system
MKLLLDTHIFIWHIAANPKLPEKFQQEISNKNNTVYVSVISIWEALIKAKLGKLTLPEHPENYLLEMREKHQFLSLQLDEASLKQLPGLPLCHRDPFDRILICQALEHSMTIVSVDEILNKYSVKIL